MPRNESFLILGGAGLVGKQIAHRIASDASLSPRKIVIASLRNRTVEDALAELRNGTSRANIEWVGEHGDIFARDEYAYSTTRDLLKKSAQPEVLFATLFADLFDPIGEAYKHSRLVQLIRKHEPDVIIDSINTATAISYQDIDTASRRAKNEVHHLLEALQEESAAAYEYGKRTERAIYELLLSQSLPQLIRHILLLHKAMLEFNTRLYLKIGTTGTGGMGLNIPYTHSEDKPSAKLITKTAVAFAHTGLLFLMARTAGGPIVKEIKPGALIGYADVTPRKIARRHGHPGEIMYRYTGNIELLSEHLELSQDESHYQKLEALELPVIDTGENGLFTKGEFETITAMGQMEFLTPEEIAHEVVMEIQGSNTGRDVIAAIDGAVMNPTYRAGYLRHQALAELERWEERTGTHSVALGHLGPPELSKLLWEAELLKLRYGTLRAVLAHTPEEMAEELRSLLQLKEHEQLCQTIISLGLPILLPDGRQIVRGPHISIPEGEERVMLTEEDIDIWAQKGWVDLRPKNLALWQERFHEMESSRQHILGKGSAAVTIEGYIYDDIRIGEVVGWIFNNEQDGYRIKYGHRIK